MKKLCIFCACLALTAFVSCQKQQTEEERKAEIDRQVEQRLAADKQAQEKDALAQRQADLDAREKALADKQDAAQAQTPRARSTSDTRDDESGYNIFYTKLESYGDWRETSDYGYVWQPRQAQSSRNWHPYTEGRWVYTDVGWTWVSDEPFGWATYHYGRWARLRNVGWVWVPGDEWAPAWVSWRKSDDYVGWAPLPPEARFDRKRGIHTWSDNYYDVGPDQYRFVATREFGTRQTERSFVPRERNVTIISQTTNVTNITYNNTMVVNQGPNYDELRSRTQQPIERLRLEREGHVDLNGETRSVVRGEVVAIPAPAISIGISIQRPRRVKETVAQTTIEHGWDDIGDKAAAEQARTKMKSESAPPADAPSKTFVKPVFAVSSTTTATTAAGSTATPSPLATASATASVASTRAAVAPSPSASPFASASSPSLTPAAPRAPHKPITMPSATATATSTVTPPARKFTPPPAATAAPSASASASASTAGAATSVESPAVSPTRPRRSPPGVLLVPGNPSASPEDRPRVGERFKSQAKKFAPPGDMPMSPSPSASASATATAKASTTPSFAPRQATTPLPTATPTPTPSPIATPAATAASSTPAAAPASSVPVASTHDDKKDRKHEGGKPGKHDEDVSPTPTPTPAAQ